MVGNRQSGRLPYHPAEKLAHGRRWLDIRDMAELLNVSTSTIRRWWERGKRRYSPAIAGRRQWLCLALGSAQIEAFIAKRLGENANCEDEAIPSNS